MISINEQEQRIKEIYSLSLLELLSEAADEHRKNWQANDMELCALLSIKTGSCSNDCAYCAQSSHYPTDTGSHGLLSPDEILAFARSAKEKGIKRVCMSAAWDRPPNRRTFERLLGVIKEVRKLGIEVCSTLGQLSKEQAENLRDAGLNYYNHNIDTSPEHYSKIVTTRTFEDRLDTISHLRGTGIHLCCGGILGMGESHADRIKMLTYLASMDPTPASVPINVLVKIQGTPMENYPDIDPFEVIRVIAVARIILPKTRIRLSAGRNTMSRETQALAFVAGANSIFVGNKLLTTPLPGEDFDSRLICDLLKPLTVAKYTDS